MFAEPVSDEDAPGYADMIERPKDLGTLIAGIAPGFCIFETTMHAEA